MLNSPLLLASVIVIPIVAIGAVLWQRTLALSIPFLAALNGLPIVVGTTNVRPEQLIALLLSLALGITVMLGQRRLYLDQPAKWLGVVAALHLLSSVLFSPARSYSVQQTASLMSVWATYVLIINYVEDARVLRRFFAVFVAAGICYSSIGVLAFAFARAGFDVGGANIDVTSGYAYGAFGTMYEPNIFGSYCGAYFLVALGTLFFTSGRSRRESSKWAWPLLVSAGLGLLLSFTRGAWLGVLVSLPVMVWLGKRFFGMRIRMSQLLPPIALFAAASVAFWFMPFEGAEFFRYKIRNLVNVQSDNAVLRMLTYGLAGEQFLNRPWLGWGTYTFAPLTVEGLPFKEFEGWHALWIGNFVLQVAHDTGIVGLFAFGALLWTLLRSAVASARVWISRDVASACYQLSVLLAFGSLLIAFLFTTGFVLAYSWMFAGVLAAFTRVALTAEAAGARSA